MNDHRRKSRQTCLVPVDGNQHNGFSSVRTLDISSGGMGFVSQSKLPLKKRIAVELMLTPDADPVLVLGEVRWVKPISNSSLFRVGMKFVKSIADGGRTRLNQYFNE